MNNLSSFTLFYICILRCWQTSALKELRNIVQIPFELYRKVQETYLLKRTVLPIAFAD